MTEKGPAAGRRVDASDPTYERTSGRQVRATALGRGTQGVLDVRTMVETQFHVAFPHRVWVAGEVGAVIVEDEDGLRFWLHPATSEDRFSLPCTVPADTLPAVRDLLHRTHDAVLDDVVQEGRLARVGGLVRFDAVRGSVVLLVSEFDPTPTELALAEVREQAVLAVTDGGLSFRQREIAFPPAPLDVAVVGPTGDQAVAAVAQQLSGSPYDVRVQVLPVVLTGTGAPAALEQAVRSASQDSDVVLLVRGEGRPLELAAYDALEAAQAVADSPVPVVTGLGGGPTRTACDVVASTALPTAQDAAQRVLDRLAAAERSLEALTGEVEQAVAGAAERSRVTLSGAEAAVEQAAQDAAARSDASRRRWRKRFLVASGVLVAVAVLAAVLLQAPLALLVLLLPVLVVAGVRLWSVAVRSGGRRRMGKRDDDFTEVVRRLHAVRDELTGTSSPEKVAVLRDEAADLLARGRGLLGRHVGEPVGAPGPVAATATTAAVPAQPAEPVVATDPPDREPDPAT